MLISYIWYIKDMAPLGKLQCRDAFLLNFFNSSVNK